MKVPGPDHPITIEETGERVLVSFAGRPVANTGRALVMREAGYSPVYYVPRADAAMDAFRPTDKQTHCPYKGDAGYFTLVVENHEAENAVWTYEAPYPAVSAIGDYLAFYPDKVTIEVEPAL